MSWWAPSNGKIQKYLDAWPRRIVIVLVVWLPILITLFQIVENKVIVWLIGILVFSAFSLRLHFFDRALKEELINGGTRIEPNKLPEVLYFIVFTWIWVLLYHALSVNNRLVPVAILSIFLGASMMSRFRRGEYHNLSWDIVGRIVFIMGFLLNLYNLVQAL